MTHTHRDEEVVVIGGGPVGLLAANALSNSFRRVTILERQLHPMTMHDRSRAYTMVVSARGLDAVKRDTDVYNSLRSYSLCAANPKRVTVHGDGSVSIG